MRKYRIIPSSTDPGKWVIERLADERHEAELLVMFDTQAEARDALARFFASRQSIGAARVPRMRQIPALMPVAPIAH